MSAIRRRLSSAFSGAIALATGDSIGFLNHDDALTNDALHWIARAIVDMPNVDVIYADESRSTIVTRYTKFSAGRIGAQH